MPHVKRSALSAAAGLAAALCCAPLAVAAAPAAGATGPCRLAIAKKSSF